MSWPGRFAQLPSRALTQFASRSGRMVHKRAPAKWSSTRDGTCEKTMGYDSAVEPIGPVPERPPVNPRRGAPARERALGRPPFRDQHLCHLGRDLPQRRRHQHLHRPSVTWSGGAGLPGSVRVYGPTLPFPFCASSRPDPLSSVVATPYTPSSPRRLAAPPPRPVKGATRKPPAIPTSTGWQS